MTRHAAFVGRLLRAGRHSGWLVKPSGTNRLCPTEPPLIVARNHPWILAVVNTRRFCFQRRRSAPRIGRRASIATAYLALCGCTHPLAVVVAKRGASHWHFHRLRTAADHPHRDAHLSAAG